MKITIKTNVKLDKISIWKINQIGLVNSSQKLVKQARENAPYETGTLKKSIWTEPGQITSNTKTVKIGPRKVIYAVRREFENKKNPGKKFYMKKTFDKAEDVVKKEFEKAVNIVINSI